MAGVHVKLPSVLGIANVSGLQAQLLSERGKQVIVDGSGVERMGALGLQVLLAAARTWQIDQIDFSIASASEAFRAALKHAGAQLPGVSA